MNTPKLISILSSPVGGADPFRIGQAADPAHGLDFSRLLGEARNQSASPAIPQRPSQDPGRRSNSTDAQARAHTPPARQDDNRRDTASTGHASAPGGASGIRENTARGENQVAGRDGDSKGQPDSGSATDPSPGRAGSSNSSSSHPNPSPESDGAQGAAHAEAPETDTQLAEAAAEVGAPVGAAGHALQALLTQEGGARVPAPSAAAAQAADGKASANASLPVPGGALHDLDAELSFDKAAAGVQRLMTGQAAVPQQAATPAAQIQAALAQAFNGIDAVAARSANTAATPAAASNASADALPANALPLPIATETANSAAALSLQDFTAMVAAARATSGTALPPASSLATPASVQLHPTAMAGLVPAGLFPGQAPTSTAMPLGAGIPAPLGSPQWPTELGRQFVSIAQAANGLGQVAELRLDPPELGPLRITINLNDNVAHAVFSSPHALVRQTVENALPQLQQMLEQAGISLGQANVNDQHQSGQASQQQTGEGGPRAQAAAGGGLPDGSAGTDTARQARPADPNALVDTFA